MKEKMNVLFIITDAQRVDHLSCYGNNTLKTPNIDKFASESVRFTNYFCTNPICMPNRATMITGLYPNVHGVRSNGINLKEGIPTITKTLRNRGWHTVAIGKIHHQFWMAPFKRKSLSAENLASWAYPKGRNDPVRDNFPNPYYGYDEVELVVGNGSICSGHYIEWLEEKSPCIAKEVKKRCLNYDYLFSLYCDDIPEEYYNTTYVKERTIAFLERFIKGNYGNKPFYLHCSFPDPHYPIIPPKSFRDMYHPEDIELPASFNNIEKLYNHKFLGEYLKNPPFKKAFLRETTEDEVRKITALTYASIAYIDYSIGQILTFLDKSGISDSTIVIYSSDHGDLMGDHGLLFKGPCPYNGVLQLPLIWKVPGLTSKGFTSDSLVSTIDYPKTILSLLGIKEKHQPQDMQGFDITPTLENPETKIRDCCFIENDEEIGLLKSRLRHLITEEYKLTVYENLPGYGDIYSRKNDPDELNNLWYNKEFKGKRFELVDKLLHEYLKAQSYYPKRIAGT
ncbi:MAG: sulfatase [Candidatus Thorarchaeota archaeon]